MTDTTAPASSISVMQLMAALQTLGIDVKAPYQGNEEADTTTQSQLTSLATPAVSARISSPWVPTSVVPLAVPASKTLQESSPPSALPAVTPAVTPGPNDAVSGFTCQNCHHYNVLHSAGDTWYTVTAGRKVGVFRGWHRVQALVSGVPHASYRRYPSEAAATTVFEDAKAEGLVVIIV